MNILKDSFKDSIKYILTRVFVLVIAGLIFITIFYFIGKKYEKEYNVLSLLGISNAYAYTVEDYRLYSSMNPNGKSGRFTDAVGNASSTLNIPINIGTNINADTDYVGFRFTKFLLEDIRTNPVTWNCTATPNSIGNSTGISCWSGMESQQLDFVHQMTMFVGAYYGNNPSELRSCFVSDSLKDIILCPAKVDGVDGGIYKINIELSFMVQEQFYYDIQVARRVIFINNESTGIINAIEGLENNQQSIIDNITDSSTTSSGSSFTTFVNNYTNTIPNNITRIVATPLQTIVNLQGSTCSPLELTIPFMNQQLVLPCMSDIYQQYFGAFFTLYQVIVSGLITYWCIIGVLNTVKSLLDANDDKIEVLDL